MKTDSFAPIRLEEMEQVRLMNRTDTKYWFNEKCLNQLLEEVQNDYFILNMNNEVLLPYSTVYYDTVENQMYNAHHNGKLNRYKVRRRTYVSSGISFLEVKFKTNKGRTIKKRVSSGSTNNSFTSEEQVFLRNNIPFTINDLQTSLFNHFSRIMLVDKSFKERCTIDFNLQFSAKNKNVALNNFVVVEIKTDGSPSASSMASALYNQGIKPSGFSKYCIGRTIIDTSLKRNAFKRKIRALEKVTKTGCSLFN